MAQIGCQGSSFRLLSEGKAEAGVGGEEGSIFWKSSWEAVGPSCLYLTARTESHVHISGQGRLGSVAFQMLKA